MHVWGCTTNKAMTCMQALVPASAELLVASAPEEGAGWNMPSSLLTAIEQ